MNTPERLTTLLDDTATVLEERRFNGFFDDARPHPDDEDRDLYVIPEGPVSITHAFALTSDPVAALAALEVISTVHGFDTFAARWEPLTEPPTWLRATTITPNDLAITFGAQWADAVATLDYFSALTSDEYDHCAAACVAQPFIEWSIARNRLRAASRVAGLEGPMFSIDRIIDTALLYRDPAGDTLLPRTAVSAAAFERQLPLGEMYTADDRDRLLAAWQQVRTPGMIVAVAA